MSVAQAVRRWCRIEDDAVPFAVRRRELTELAAIVAAALVFLAFSPPPSDGPAWLWASVIVGLALPFGAAWTLRRTVGKRAFATAAILEVGLVAALLVSATTAQVQELSSQAMVAAAMVWVLGSNPRTSTRAALSGAAILALAFAVAALI